MDKWSCLASVDTTSKRVAHFQQRANHSVSNASALDLS